MAYLRPENLGSHGERRIIGILTVTNIVGGLAGLALLWLLAGLLGLGGEQPLTASWLLRAGLASAGALGGVVATLRWTGISLWDTVMLWAGYQVRRSSGRTLLTPPPAARLPGVRTRAPLMRGGKVIAELYDPHAASVQALEDDHD
jgi:hypothetical protein